MSGDATLRLRADGVEWRLVEGEVVALDLRRSEYLSINASGAVLWPLLAEGVRREALVGALEERFELDRARAEQDADAFVEQLRARELLEP